VELTVKTTFSDVHSGPQPDGAAPSPAFDEMLASFKPASR